MALASYDYVPTTRRKEILDPMLPHTLQAGQEVWHTGPSYCPCKVRAQRQMRFNLWTLRVQGDIYHHEVLNFIALPPFV